MYDWMSAFLTAAFIKKLKMWGIFLPNIEHS